MAEQTAPANLVVIEDAVLNRLIRNPSAVEAFPFLKAAATALTTTATGKKCTPCMAKKNQAIATTHYAEIKRAISAMSADKQIELKRFLNAKQARVLYRGYDNKLIRKTF